MAKKKTKKKKMTPQQRKFSKAAKKCRKETKPFTKSFGSCMSKEASK